MGLSYIAGVLVGIILSLTTAVTIMIAVLVVKYDVLVSLREAFNNDSLQIRKSKFRKPLPTEHFKVSVKSPKPSEQEGIVVINKTDLVESLKAAMLSVKSVDLGPANMIDIFRGDATGPSVRDFFAQVEHAAILGGWKPQLRVTVARLKSRGAAGSFLMSRFNLSKLGSDGLPETKYEEVKRACIERFSDRRTEQYRYIALQTAVQRSGESVEVFAERIRDLGVRTIKKNDDPSIQTVIEKEGERRMNAAFLPGLIGKVGEVARFAFPESFDQAVHTAVMAEREELSRPKGGNRTRVPTVTHFGCGREERGDTKCFKTSLRGVSYRQSSLYPINRYCDVAYASSTLGINRECFGNIYSRPARDYGRWVAPRIF